ncbi:UDP-N-acetylmuramate dehydrogenase [Corynebacterium bovis]|uniref:UDP-N-acetylmuramate dehydrogenase n=1 Tax=Corynebacterium bovis TaxID=36808 RepID=UPI00244BEAEF|nr:UDP-N-acetylmuramate dehydrogenase [Corynebacterium bovis]MDH2455768.1 UDP-N-acetylmuramate dehydrogenase [Corynebacterium bovis]
MHAGHGLPQGAHIVATDFAHLTTLRTGGTPAATVACTTPEAVAAVVRDLDAAGRDVLVVGGGSNLVVGEDVGGLVVVLVTTGDDARLPGADAPAPGDPAGGVGGGSAGGDVTVDRRTGTVRAFAGVTWDDLVARTVAEGLGGLECLSGIPGSVGATPVQNVGAYGAEVSQTLSRVHLHDRTTGRSGWVGPEDLDLGYRHSNLKFTGRAVVTEVEFTLRTDGLSLPLRFGELARRLGVDADAAADAGDGARRPVAEVREAVLDLRRGKGMVLDPDDHDTWSAGSFFTNPVVVGDAARDAVIARVRERCGDAEAAAVPCYAAGVSAATDRPVAAAGGPGAPGTAASATAAGTSGTTGTTGTGAGTPRYKFSAAWLIDRAGFPRGWHVPGNDRAGLSTRHTLALTNRGGATSADIVELARAVRDGVRAAFGVTLEPEPVWVGVTLDDPAAR